MTKEASRDGGKLINQILEIELDWFLTVNPTLTSECQQHPEAFKLMRSSTFETWSEDTLVLYLEHLVDARSKGRNLMREKYAKIAKLAPCENFSSVPNECVEIQERWQEEARHKYPRIFREGAEGEFASYLRCELDTYSPAVLESYLNDLKAALLEGRNLVIKTYDRIAKKLGYSSLEEWHQQRAVTGNHGKFGSL